MKASGLDDLKPLSKAELVQHMLTAEKHRYTEEIVRDVYNSVLEEAKSGKDRYITEFKGCDNSNPQISEGMCISIVNDVFSIINTKFPDSTVTYDSDNKEFKIIWAN
jgi:hypothetical protein